MCGACTPLLPTAYVESVSMYIKSSECFMIVSALRSQYPRIQSYYQLLHTSTPDLSCPTSVRKPPLFPPNSSIQITCRTKLTNPASRTTGKTKLRARCWQMRTRKRDFELLKSKGSTAAPSAPETADTQSKPETVDDKSTDK